MLSVCPGNDCIIIPNRKLKKRLQVAAGNRFSLGVATLNKEASGTFDQTKKIRSLRKIFDALPKEHNTKNSSVRNGSSLLFSTVSHIVMFCIVLCNCTILYLVSVK